MELYKKIELGYKDLPPTLMVELDDNFRKKLFFLLKSKFKNKKEICTYLNCSASSLDYYRRGNYFIPSEIFKKAIKIDNFNDKEVNLSILRVKKRLCGKPVGIILPIQVSSDLSALIGHTLGDGHISSGGRFVYVNKEKILIDKVKSLVNNVFQGDIYFDERLKKEGFISLHYPSAVGEILEFFGSRKGNKVLQDFDIPHWIKYGCKEYKSAFLRAMFDDEGSVSDRIALNMSKIEDKEPSLIKFLDSLRGLLIDLNVQPKKVLFSHRRVSKKNVITINLVFLISGYYNIQNFCKNIGFHHEMKQQKLEHLLNSYTQPPGKTRENILKLLNNKTLSTHKIRQQLNKTKSGVKYNLVILENEGEIERIIIDKRLHLWKRKWTK